LLPHKVERVVFNALPNNLRLRRLAFLYAVLDEQYLAPSAIEIVFREADPSKCCH
jgi:hypothetical protein